MIDFVLESDSYVCDSFCFDDVDGLAVGDFYEFVCFFWDEHCFDDGEGGRCFVHACEGDVGVAFAVEFGEGLSELGLVHGFICSNREISSHV